MQRGTAGWDGITFTEIRLNFHEDAGSGERGAVRDCEATLAGRSIYLVVVKRPREDRGPATSRNPPPSAPNSTRDLLIRGCRVGHYLVSRDLRGKAAHGAYPGTTERSVFIPRYITRAPKCPGKARPTEY
ncbi:hypothetical protein HN011_002278 [Eciton burchellii]|nr:hypothetical protein HN011_002278 [Eciton burchellii]